MLKKISFLFFIVSVLFIQSVLVSFSNDIYIALHLCLLISIVFSLKDFSWWFLFAFGLFLDFLMFRYLGFTAILFLIISLISKSTSSVIGVIGGIGRFFMMIFVLFIGICFENLMFNVFEGGSFDVIFILNSLVWNIPVLIGMVGLVNLLSNYLLEDEKI